jgi:lysophospholipase L1-like esterase
VVNCTKVTHQERGEEIILDTLAAAQPKKLYILLGTNTLTTAGSEERFLTYYSAMLDTLRTQLGDDCVIYVQSIPPVRPAVQEERSGLASDNLRVVNESLAQMAAEKGCVYLDLWEALADGAGNLSDLYDAPDGIHLSAGDGYSAWVSYLRTHAVYAEDNEWTPGSVYAQE